MVNYGKGKKKKREKKWREETIESLWKNVTVSLKTVKIRSSNNEGLVTPKNGWKT